MTPAEADVMFLLTEEFLTPNQMACRRDCSKQAISRHIVNLKRKGVINGCLQRVDKSQPTSQHSQPKSQLPEEMGVASAHPIRLHGQEFNVQILYMDEKYARVKERSNLVMVDGNKVRLYKKSIEIYSGQDFFGEDAQAATSKSFKYWDRFFARLEHDLKVILVKPRSQNIKLVNSHYAETNNELAKDCINKARHIRVYAKDDGKLWFLIDDSFNLKEAETVHPQTSKLDMDVVKAHFNDIRDNSPPTLSKIMGVLNEIATVNKETACGLNSVVSVMKSQLPKKQEIVPAGRPDYFG